MRYKLQVILALALISFIIWPLERQWRAYQKVPRNFQWNAVDYFLKARASEDDLLLFEPAWLAGFAQDHDRLNRYSVVGRKEVLKGTFPPSSKLWVISFELPTSLEHPFQKTGISLEESHSIYSLSVKRYRLPAKGVSYDFSAHLAEAEAFIDYGDDRITKGEWKGEAWVFPDEPVSWNQIRLETQPFRRRMHRCIWFHPLENGVKTLSFSNVPPARTLRIFGGIVDSGVRVPPGSPIDLSITVDEKPVEEIRFQDTDTQFYYLIDTAAFSGNHHEVTFRIRTSRQPFRHFCFSAWSRKG